MPVSAKRGPGRPRKDKSKNATAPDQGTAASAYNSDDERVAEAIAQSLADAMAGEAEAPRMGPDSSSLRCGRTANVRHTRFQSEERVRQTGIDEFQTSARQVTAEAEVLQRAAQRPGRIEFDDEVVHSAPVEEVLAAAQLQIQEQVNKRVAKVKAVRARMEHTRKLQEEERRRQAAVVEAEVQRRVQEMLLAEGGGGG